jgi:hypothetical protein
VIEVDGPVHDHGLKMKKDNIKEALLESLGILVFRVENREVAHPMVNQVFREIRGFPRLDYRGRQRLMKSVYLETLLMHSSDQKVQSLLEELS